MIYFLFWSLISLGKFSQLAISERSVFSKGEFPYVTSRFLTGKCKSRICTKFDSSSGISSRVYQVGLSSRDLRPSNFRDKIFLQSRDPRRPRYRQSQPRGMASIQTAQRAGYRLNLHRSLGSVSDPRGEPQSHHLASMSKISSWLLRGH